MISIVYFSLTGERKSNLVASRAGQRELCLSYLLRGLLHMLMHPAALLPATTALGTIDPMGREKGILAGANVVMPNLSPAAVRKKYALYDNKLSDGDESAQGVAHLRERMAAIGYEIVTARGDYPAPSHKTI